MRSVLRQLPAPADSALTWVLWFYAAGATIFVLYVGVALLMATRKTNDEIQAKIRYQIFRDLLELFYRRSL